MIYTMPGKQVLRQLASDEMSGISSEEAVRRLREYGRNALPEKKPPSPLVVLVRQCLSPLMFILLIAALLSLGIAQYKDALVILLAACINIVVGFFQEWKAEQAARALQAYETYECVVLRNGGQQVIDARLLVPGDIVLLRAGSRVPADMRLLSVHSLIIEEAILTGESEPVLKGVDLVAEDAVLGDRSNMAYLGTYILNGTGKGVVVATGLQTELGHIARLVQETGIVKTPIQKQLGKLSWFLGLIMVAVSAIVAMLGFLQGLDLYAIVSLAVALAVAAIPEGLLIAFTVVLAVGMQRMAKKNALIKRLIAAETLGGVRAVCTDKTGTVTRGKLSVDTIVTKNHTITLDERIPDEVYDLLVMGVLNNDAYWDSVQKTFIGFPVEVAILKTAQTAKISMVEKREKFLRIAEMPFSSIQKYMATVHRGGDRERLIVKGAPEVIFRFCSKFTELASLQQQADELSRKGLRLLAIAYKDAPQIALETDLKDLLFAGLIGFGDQVRESATETVRQLKNAGIKLILVTGDHAQTAANIGKNINLSQDEPCVYSGAELTAMSDEELKKRALHADIFARVEPAHKVRIISALQDTIGTVAMIGDGVNDAPAIKRANIGIALGSGTDLTSEIADMVLLDDNLATVNAAVLEGRIIFDNLRKIVTYLLVDSFSAIVLIAAAILFGLPLPLLPVQILWINVISDGFPYLALTVEPAEPGIMQESPSKYNEPLVNKEVQKLITIAALITALGLLALYLALYLYGIEITHLRTIIFSALAVDSLLYVFSIRSFRRLIIHMNPLENSWLVPAALLGFLFQLAAIYIPWLRPLFSTVMLSWGDWLVIFVPAVVKLAAIEYAKWWFIIAPHTSQEN